MSRFALQWTVSARTILIGFVTSADISFFQTVEQKFCEEVPVVWREDKDHVTDCCFWMMNLKGISRKNKLHVQYSFDPNVADTTDTAEFDASKPEEGNRPRPLTQVTSTIWHGTWTFPRSLLSYWVHSRLREKRLLAPGPTFCWYRNRETKLWKLFTLAEASSPVYCNNVADLIK